MQPKRDKGRPAKSTTEEEMSDLLWHTSHKFQKKTGHWPYLCFDNNKIQKNIDVTHIPYPEGCTVNVEGDGVISLPADHKIPLTTHSPDCNGPAEHAFSYGKAQVRNHLYSCGKRITTGAELRKAVRQQFEHNLPDGAVAADVARLPVLWEMISTDVGLMFEDEDGKMHHGTGGNWGPKGFM